MCSIFYEITKLRFILVFFRTLIFIFVWVVPFAICNASAKMRNVYVDRNGVEGSDFFSKTKVQNK